MRQEERATSDLKEEAPGQGAASLSGGKAREAGALQGHSVNQGLDCTEDTGEQ